LYVPEFGFCCVPEDAEEIILIIVVCGQLGHFISRLLIEEEKKNSHAGIKPTPLPPPLQRKREKLFSRNKKKVRISSYKKENLLAFGGIEVRKCNK
jgi:hypothetical protein